MEPVELTKVEGGLSSLQQVAHDAYHGTVRGRSCSILEREQSYNKIFYTFSMYSASYVFGQSQNRYA